jgi:hypothetical protein
VLGSVDHDTDTAIERRRMRIQDSSAGCVHHGAGLSPGDHAVFSGHQEITEAANIGEVCVVASDDSGIVNRDDVVAANTHCIKAVGRRNVASMGTV